MRETSIPTDLAAVGRRFYDRGWVFGTSGNFSAVLGRDPLRLAITSSSVHKGTLDERDILTVDDRGLVVSAASSDRRPSAETRLHVEIVRRTNAGAVLHTHSVWGTMLSSSPSDGFAIEGYEMLKGLAGVSTHEHREWVPILDNDQDMSRLAAVVGETVERHPSAHGILLRRHGLYTWGTTLADAERHVEIFEFLFETIGRAASFSAKTQEVYHGVVESS